MKAISIRQPWAWLILHGGKDIENRGWSTRFRGRVLIHASKQMTRGDYQACILFIAAMRRAWRVPAFDILRAQCGGLVGEVEITDCVTQSASPWFCGEFGFVLANPKPLPFAPCRGRLGFFECPDEANPVNPPAAPRRRSGSVPAAGHPWRHSFIGKPLKPKTTS